MQLWHITYMLLPKQDSHVYGAVVRGAHEVAANEAHAGLQQLLVFERTLQLVRVNTARVHSVATAEAYLRSPHDLACLDSCWPANA